MRLGARREGGDVVLDVSDNGAGVPAGEREKVFELFYSTRKGGTGLGLAIARRIARAHGGDRLGAGAAEGGGAVFSVPLPVAGAPAHQGGSVAS